MFSWFCLDLSKNNWLFSMIVFDMEIAYNIKKAFKSHQNYPLKIQCTYVYTNKIRQCYFSREPYHNCGWTWTSGHVTDTSRYRNISVHTKSGINKRICRAHCPRAGSFINNAPVAALRTRSADQWRTGVICLESIKIFASATVSWRTVIISRTFR